MFDQTALHGIIPPICTPLTPGGEVDVESARRLVEFQLSAGVHGLFVLGSTGELAVLTAEQRRLMLETAVAAGHFIVPVRRFVVELVVRFPIFDERSFIREIEGAAHRRLLILLIGIEVAGAAGFGGYVARRGGGGRNCGGQEQR